MLLKHKSGLVAVLIVAAMTGSWLNVAPASAATSYVEGTDAGAANALAVKAKYVK